MSIEEAADYFTEPALAKIVRGLVDVGLGYLTWDSRFRRFRAASGSA